jgi:hypothetical protein
VSQLERRGIRVSCGLLSAKAKGVLTQYSARGGVIYNGFSANL